MISRELLDSWAAAHRDWPRLIGAVAEANMLRDETDADVLLLRLPTMPVDHRFIIQFAIFSRAMGDIVSSISAYSLTAPVLAVWKR